MKFESRTLARRLTRCQLPSRQWWIANRTTTEGIATAPIAVEVRDAESALTQLEVTTSILASQPDTLVAPDNVSVISLATGYAIIVTPNRHQSGTVTLRITATDPEGGNATRDFVIVVSAVNDAVTIDPVPEQAFAEDSRHVVTLTGISAGPGESQPIALDVTTDRPQLFSELRLTYLSPPPRPN